MSYKLEQGRLLIPGGAGFLGKHLVKGLLNRYSSIRIKVISRSENEVVELMTTCLGDKRVTPVIGDIRNNATLEYALQGIDSVFHLAAMKHIDLCENNVTEAVLTNVRATMNLLDLFEGDSFVSMSTDKVAGAQGCYGATKLLMEKLTLEQGRLHPDRRYMVVRSGNIFGSAGSVIPKWVQQIKKSNTIQVTSMEMTRFFIDPATLVEIMMDIMDRGENGKVYIPEQVVIRLQDMAEAVVAVYGKKDTKIEVVGPREGEKMHERLFFPEEKNIVTTMTADTSDKGVSNDIRVPNKGSAILKEWLKKYANDTGHSVPSANCHSIPGTGWTSMGGGID